MSSTEANNQPRLNAILASKEEKHIRRRREGR